MFINLLTRRRFDQLLILHSHDVLVICNVLSCFGEIVYNLVTHGDFINFLVLTVILCLVRFLYEFNVYIMDYYKKELEVCVCVLRYKLKTRQRGGCAE